VIVRSNALSRSRPKYGNQKVTTPDGLTFDSKREHGEWVKLEALARKGVIERLQRQVPYKLRVNGQTVCRYVADFTWHERVQGTDEWRHVVADAKGYITAEFKLKAKLFKALYGCDIRLL
jgi:hypothetical protein